MLQVLVVGLTILANFFVAGTVLQRNYRSATHILIATLSIIAASWTLFNFLALSSGPEEVRLFWVRVVMLVTTPFGVIIFLISSVFPGRKLELDKKSKIGLFVLVWITAFLCMTNLVFEKLTNTPDGNFSLTPGPGIILYAICLLLFMTWGFIRFFKKMRHSSGIQKLQLKVVVTGITVSFTLLTLTNFIAVVLFNSIQLTFLGPPFTLIMVAAMTYAVLKHRLFDIRLTIARSISFSVLLILLALLYSTILFVTTKFVLKETISAQTTVVFTLIALPLLVLFQTFKKLIERYTEKLFFRYEYDLEKAVQEVGSVMSFTLNLEELLRGVSTTLTEKLKADTIQSIVMDSTSIYTNKSINQDNSLYPKLLELTKKAQPSEDNILVFDELEETPLKQKMRDLNIAVVVALEIKNKLLGGVLLSFKNTGESYSPHDISLLRILAPQLSIAVQNAESYEKIRQFNITMEDEVDKATKKLVVANRQLKELDKLKDEFISIASHELRTPMTSIKSYIWLALQKTKKRLTTKERFYLERSYSATERLIKLVNDMLNISRIEAGRVSLEVQKVDLIELVQEVIDEVKARAEELKILLILDKSLEKDLKKKVLVLADVDKIKEVLINIIGNALKFTSPKGSITVSFEEKNDHIVTSITDTGAGIEPEILPTLFRKYGLIKGSYRTNQESTQGTGLGLYICKSIIELHEGIISVDSKGKGTGTTFNFSLKKYSEKELKHFLQIYKK